MGSEPLLHFQKDQIMSKAVIQRSSESNVNLAKSIQQSLVELKDKVVFAESCTGGEISATLACLPGISKNLCGSIVSYRPSSKQNWLGVDCRTIEKHTTESDQVANEMAIGALKMTPEASWAVSIVGHFGPDAPPEKDGMIYICVMRRTKKGNLKICEKIQHRLNDVDRSIRQKMATEVCLSTLGRILIKRKSDQK